MPLADPGPGRVLLELDRELICAVAGDVTGVVPASVGEPVGRDVLDLVHPVDRPLVRRWLAEGVGASEPFRRADADEPPRWFRLLATEPAPGTRLARVLLEEVTDAEHRASLRRRLMGILAREPGEGLLERGATLAAELAGASHAWMAERFGPLLLVRSVHGEGLEEQAGATVPLAGDPGEAAVSSGQLRTFEAGLADRWPESSLVRRAGVASGVAVPLRVGPAGPVTGVLVVASRETRRFDETELELLVLLAARLGLEMGERRQGPSGGTDAASGALQAGLDALANAFANVLAAVGLNCELVLGDPRPAAIRRRLERVLEVAERGRWLARTVPGLAGGRAPSLAPVPVADLLDGAREVVQLAVEGATVRAVAPEEHGLVLADEALLLSGVLFVSVPLTSVARPGLTVELGATAERDEHGVEWLVLTLAVAEGASGAEVWGGSGAVAAVRRAAEALSRQGGRLRLVEGPAGVRVEIWLQRARASDRGGGLSSPR